MASRDSAAVAVALLLLLLASADAQVAGCIRCGGFCASKERA